MTKPSITKRETYLAQADSWSRDRLDAVHNSRRIAWIVASVAAVIAVCEALALLALVPLKRVEPYTLLVDRQTGYVQQLKSLDPQLVGSREALTQSFLVQYVIAREGFDIDALQDDYRKVATWSSGDARNEYLALMPASNPQSPLARYPRSTTIEVAIKSVASIGNNVALVRFDTLRHDAGQQPVLAGSWAAVVRYDYVNKPMSAADRFINPLGFQVTQYRRSAEALTPASAPFAPAAGVAGPLVGRPPLAPGVQPTGGYGANRP